MVVHHHDTHRHGRHDIPIREPGTAPAGSSHGSIGGTICPVSVDNALWRAIGVFRVAALVYSVALAIDSYRQYRHPGVAVAVLVVMAAWSAATVWAYRRPSYRTWSLVAADVAVTAVCLIATGVVVPEHFRHTGTPTLTAAWEGAPVIACAVKGGRRWATAAALALGGMDIALRGALTQNAFTGTVLMLLAGFAVGYLTALARSAEQRMQEAVELEAATRERERLGRGIHDGVLQVLALVQRRGAELGGDGAELSRVAGEQEARLRSLVGLDGSVPPVTGRAARPAGTGDLVDLRYLLRPLSGARVQLVEPSTPTVLPARTATELVAAVGSALDNVRVHAGPRARAWVLIEQEAGSVTVTVRDDGPGMAPGRVAEAAAAGRLGIAQSITGRVRDLGGEVTITTAAARGVEVEMRVPRPRSEYPYSTG
jgi:signal transduction histidine kinase